MNLPLVSERDAVVRLKDIAEVRRNYKDPESIARHFGEKTVSIEISKRTGENIIDTVAMVRKVVEKEKAPWPPIVQELLSNVVYEEIKRRTFVSPQYPL